LRACRLYHSADLPRLASKWRRDEQKYSIQNQAAAIAACAARQGLAIVRIYKDEGRSGLRLDRRQKVNRVTKAPSAKATFFPRGRDFLAMRGREESHRGNQTLALEAQAGPSASKARRYSFVPFSLRGDAPQPPTAGEVVAPRSAAAVEAQTAPTEVRRPSHTRRGFAISWIAATLVTAALVGICFHAEVVAGDEAAQLKQAAESATAELRQSLQREHDRAEALATELAQARRTMEPKPAGVEEKPAAKQSEDVEAENSKPENKPVETAPLPKRVEHEPRGRALSPNCFHYRTYDPASGTYRSFDGRIRSCR
jgi:hypothetical protein